MSASRSGLAGLTLVVGLGVAVTTSQGTAMAEPTDPGPSASESTAPTAQSNETGTGQEADAESNDRSTTPDVKESPRSTVDGTSITIRRPDDTDESEDARGDEEPAETTEQEPPPAHADETPPTTPSPVDTATAATKKHDETDSRPTIFTSVKADDIDVPEAAPINVVPSPPRLMAAKSVQAQAQPQAVSTPSTARVAPARVAPPSSVAAAAPVAAAAAPAPVIAPVRFIANLFGLLGFDASATSPARPLLPVSRLIELASVAIRRTFFNQAPTAQLDTKSLQVDLETGDATGKIVATDRDGDALTYRVVNPPAQGGTVTVARDGTFSYAAPEGWAHDGGTVNFTIAVSDETSPHLHLFDGGLFGHGHVATVEVSYAVSPVNHAPVVTVTDGGVQPDGTVTYTVRTSDRDGDDVMLATQTVNGALRGGPTGTDPATGDDIYRFTFTPDEDYAHDLAIGGKTDPGQGRVTFTATDSLGAVGDAVTKTIAIDPVNADPVMTVTPGAGGVYTIEVTDDDGDDIDLTTNVVNGTLTGGATSPGHYLYTFTVDEKWQHDLTLPTRPGISTATVGFTATDGHGGDDEYAQDITVTGTNSVPTVSVVENNGVYTVTVRDGDPGDVVTLTPRAVNGTLTGGETSTRGVYVYTFTVDPVYAHGLTLPGQPGTGTAAVEFVATDDHQGTSTTYRRDFAVAGQNSEPTVQVVNGSTTISTTTGLATFTIKAADADPGDAATITSVGAPGQGTLIGRVQNGDGSWTLTYRADYPTAHALGPNGQASVAIPVTMTDGHGAEPTTNTVTVTVVGLNRPPELDTEPTLTRSTGVVSGIAAWTDRDGDTLTNRTATLSDPSKGELAYNPTTGAYGFTPNADARAAAAVVGAPLDDRRVIVTFAVDDGFGPHTEAVSVLIAPPDNVVLGSFDSDDVPDTDGRPNSVVVSPDGTSIIVGNSRRGYVTRIDAQTGAVLDSYNIGDRDGVGSTQQLVVSRSTTNPVVYALAGDGAVYRIDATTGEIEAVASQGGVRQIAVSPDGTTFYYASSDVRGNVLLRAIDADGNDTPVTRLPDDPGQILVDPVDGYVVIDASNTTGSGGYGIIDPADGSPVGRGGAFSIADFVINGQDLYAVDVDGTTVYHVLTLDGRIEQKTFSVTDASKIVVSPDGQRAYVLTGSNRVTVLDITRDATRENVGSITVPARATDIAISPDGTHLYVTSDVGDKVTVISISPAEAPAEQAVGTGVASV